MALSIFFQSPTVLLAAVFLALLVVPALYRLSPIHPLAHVPGPNLPRISSFWLVYHSWAGNEATVVHKLHQKYGRIVCTGPNSVDIADGEALHAIYTEKGGFRKPGFYANFSVDGHQTIFTQTDPNERLPRAKAVLPAFSAASLRRGRHLVEQCAKDWVDVMKLESQSGKPVDVLRLSNSFAADSVGLYLLGQRFGALESRRAAAIERGSRPTDLEGGRARGDGLVEFFDAIGRYWYLPPWAFNKLEWLRWKLFPNEAMLANLDIMDAFVNRVVDAAISDKQGLAWTYQGRLLQAGFSESETRAQTKDALFAGIDTTGMNLAVIVFNLAKHPDTYTRLRQEILDAKAGDDDFQSLPYLRAVVQESFRVGKVNPTRFPRVVPAGGWCFKDTFFPAGVEISCAPFDLHNDESVFERPDEFRPERWLNANKDMHRDVIPFGVGARRCIAMYLASMELYCAIQKLAEDDVLAGAKCCSDNIEIMEWFNSKFVGAKANLKWV